MMLVARDGRWLLLVVALCGVCAPARAYRLVAIGDTHGDFNNTVRVLKLAGVMGNAYEWIGGDTVLVQTGDTTDRGPFSLHIVEMMRDLQEDAARKGGEVHLCMGNHELMILQNDLRYTAPNDLIRTRLSDQHDASSETEQWLLNGLSIVHVVHDMIFSHGGVMPQWAVLGSDELVRLTRRFWRSGEHPITGDTGPMWNRIITAGDEQACEYVAESLALLGLKRQVVGHTIVRNGIEIRCGGQLILIDTALSDYMISVPSGSYNYPRSPNTGQVYALEIIDDDQINFLYDPNSSNSLYGSASSIPYDVGFPLPPDHPDVVHARNQ